VVREAFHEGVRDQIRRTQLVPLNWRPSTGGLQLAAFNWRP
jgi:hypothetical protein